MRHATAPDYQPYDEIHVTTVPRFKESGLSGDEWRISVLIEFKKKGVVIATRDFGKMENAANYMAWAYISSLELGEGEIEGARKSIEDLGLCDQEGCSDKAIVKYLIKSKSCKSCGKKKDFEYEDEFSQFCIKHSRRGDSDLIDSDFNYEKIV